MTAFIPANWLEQVEVDTGKNGAELLDSDAIITTDRNEMMAQLQLTSCSQSQVVPYLNT